MASELVRPAQLLTDARLQNEMGILCSDSLQSRVLKSPCDIGNERIKEHAIVKPFSKGGQQVYIDNQGYGGIKKAIGASNASCSITYSGFGSLGNFLLEW